MAHHSKPARKPASPPKRAAQAELQPVKDWAYPFVTNSGLNPPSTQDYLNALGGALDGFYPLGANGIWHGGIHFDGNTGQQLRQTDGVRVIADGEVVAYRLDKKYPELEYSDSRRVRYSTGFVLVRHKMALPPEPPAKRSNGVAPPADEVLEFYSLYMHLLDWDGYQAAESAASTATGSERRPLSIQRMPFWQGTANFRVGSKATSRQQPAAAPPRGHHGQGQGDVGNLSPGGNSPDVSPPASMSSVFGVQIWSSGETNAQHELTGKVIGLLPVGSVLTVSQTRTPGWATIASIEQGTPVGAVQGTDPAPQASTGWVPLGALDSMIDPSAHLDQVVVLDPPFRVRAGELIGYPGQYMHHSEGSTLPPSSISRPLVHLEVFAGDAFPAFLAKSRARADKLPDTQKPLLVVSPGAALVDVSPPTNCTVPAGSTLKPVAGKSGSGPWKRVQPVKVTPAAPPTKAHPHPRPTETSVGTAFWVDRALVGKTTGDADEVVKGWEQFPLLVSNAPVATASFLDVFTPAELGRLGDSATAVDDQDGHWWKITVGAGAGLSASGWVCDKGQQNVAKQSPWSWPGFETVDGTSLSIAEVFKRSITAEGLALPDEEASFDASAVTVNGSELFQKLQKAIDQDGNGTITAQELATAHTTSWLAEALSHLVVKYESEWGGSIDRWDALTPIMKERAPIWQSELERIQKLQWWNQQVAAVKDFPSSSATAWHFHPIGLIGNFASGCLCGRDLSMKELDFLCSDKAKSNGLFYSAFDPTLRGTDKQEFLTLLNLYMNEFEITTCLRKVHFLAQVGVECGGLDTNEENRNRDGSMPTTWAGYRGGSNYHGRGLLQMTGDDIYLRYGVFAGDPSIGTSPDIVARDLSHTIRSGCWYWKSGSAWGDAGPMADANDYYAVTMSVNGGFTNVAERYVLLNRLAKDFNVARCENNPGANFTDYDVTKSSLATSRYYAQHKPVFEKAVKLVTQARERILAENN